MQNMEHSPFVKHNRHPFSNNLLITPTEIPLMETRGTNQIVVVSRTADKMVTAEEATVASIDTNGDLPNLTSQKTPNLLRQGIFNKG